MRAPAWRPGMRPSPSGRAQPRSGSSRARPTGGRSGRVCGRSSRTSVTAASWSSAPARSRSPRSRISARSWKPPAADRPRALANNRYSADVVAIARARAALDGVGDLPTDNALPRWLAESARIPVDDLAGRWRLAIDIDGPLDLVLLGGAWPSGLRRRRSGRRRRPARAHPVRGRGPRCRAHRRRPDQRARACAGSSGRPPREPARSSRNAASGRPARASGRRRPCSAPCWSVTVPRRWARTWPGSGTGRSSTVACSSPTASGRTSGAGRRRRTGSRPICCSTNGSPTRGCAT